MKKLFALLFVLTSLIPSCDNNSSSVSFISATIEPEITHSYNEIEDRKIKWKDVFFPSKTQYFVYFYSLTCSHCNQLKNKIIEYALVNENIYFVQDSEDVVIDKNVDQTIGINDVESLLIKGFPSLVQIDNKTITKNVAGINDIILILNL